MKQILINQPNTDFYVLTDKDEELPSNLVVFVWGDDIFHLVNVVAHPTQYGFVPISISRNMCPQYVQATQNLSIKSALNDGKKVYVLKDYQELIDVIKEQKFSNNSK